MAAFKGLLTRALARLGYDLRPIEPPASRWSPERIREGAGTIRTCIDVGVGAGTGVLYEAFPDAYHVLVEPLREYEPALKAILERFEGTYVLAAAGAAAGSMTMTVERDALEMSSLVKRSELTRTDGATERREVPVTTLDQLVESHKLQPPFGLKIDTEGAELSVVEGARSMLRDTAFVIAEVSYAERFDGGYTFPEFTRFLGERGFYLHDVLQVVGERPVLYFDGLFLRVPRDGR